MTNTATIQRNTKGSMLVLIIVSIIIGTALRISLLFIYPFIAVLILAFYRFRISSSFIILLIIAGISLILSLFDNLFLKYKFLSLYYMIPFLLLLFSEPVPERVQNGNSLQIFIKCLSLVAIINNCIGFIQIILNPESDDSFIGLYSQYSISMNGLSLINTTLAFYYFISYSHKRKLATLFFSIFFFICGVISFYGAGLVVCLVAFMLSHLVLNLKKIFKPALIAFVSLGSLYFLILLFKPQIIDYNVANIKRIATFDAKNGPRKIISFYNYAISYPKNAKDFLFGSGPGTFNSRSAFMVGSPSYFSSVHLIKDEDKPYYFENYAYPLWNESNTSQQLFLDGFRNQPFSSILAFLGEYGFLFTATFLFLYYLHYRKIAKFYRKNKYNEDAAVYFRYIKFLIILLPLLLLIDNFYEYPEIMLLIVLSIKFAHLELLKTEVISY